MNRTLSAALSLAIAFPAATPTAVHADDFIRLQPGNFSSPNWYNATKMQGPNAGPPGAGDNAYLGGESVTSSGASVLSVGNGTLTLSGDFNAPTLSGGLTLSGPGKLISQTGSAVVNGGHLVIQNYTAAPNMIVSNGGSIAAGTIPDGRSGVISSGGSVTIGSSVHDLNLTVQGGGTFRAPNVSNPRSVTVTINDAGSVVTVDHVLSVKAGFLDINNGMLTVTDQLQLDGGTDQGGRPIGGGGHWQGSSAMINSQGTMFVGDKVGNFSLGIDSGAVVRSGDAVIGAEAGSWGTVAMADSDTLWNVRYGRMAIGQSGRAEFDMAPGARLLFDGGTTFAIGLAAGSNGSLSCDNAVVDARGAITSIGEGAGSSGVINLDFGSALLIARDFFVGDSGRGDLTLDSASEATASGADNKFLVGNNAGALGSVSVLGVHSLLAVAGQMTVGVSGGGFLGIADGGNVNLTHPAGLKAAAMAGGTGEIYFGPGGKLTLAGPLLLGDAGAALLTLNSNARLDLPGGNSVNLILGNQRGGSGTMTVDNFGSFADSLPILIGGSGSGAFTAALDSTVQIFGFSAPFATGGKATIIVDGSDWVNTYNIYLGSLSASAPPSTLHVRNGGTMRVGQRMTLFQSGTTTIDTGGRMAVGSGDFGPAGSLRVSAGGILSGYGRVLGQVIVAADGQIYPGSSPGILAIDGSFQLEAGSATFAEIGGTEAGTGYDQFSVTGAATLGGSLSVRLVNGFAPAVGQTFRLVNATSVSGAFASVSAPSQAGISVTSDAGGVTVTVTSVVAGAPVISSKTTATTAPGSPFHYRIAATNSPTGFGAASLPQGLTVDSSTGLVSGTLANAGTFLVPISANNAAGTGETNLMIQVDPVFNVPVQMAGRAVVEYRNTVDFPESPGGHFFYSSDAAEQSAVDAGAAGAFLRTGREFLTGGTSPVCRFYGSLTPGPNSHFFTVEEAECNALKAAQVTPTPGAVQQWNSEGIGYFTTPATVAANGDRSCGAGTQPLYRAYNNAYPAGGGKNPWDSNHRYTPQQADIAAMVAAGWRDEGIVFCTAL